MQDKTIQEFRRNFAKLFREQVIPEIKNMDKERLKAQAKVKKMWVIIAKIAVGLYILQLIFCLIVFKRLEPINEFTFFAAVCACGIGGFIAYSAKKSFELELKQKIMPILMKAFGELEWTVAPQISDYEIKRNKIIKYYESNTTDDNFIGNYKNVPFKITEAELTYQTGSGKNRRTVVAFDGVFILIDIPKNFTGHTMVLDKSDKRRQWATDYKEVKLEDVEFVKQFNVYSTDQIESRYVLTPAFMERFKNIQRTFNASTISCSFLDKELLIAVPCNKDLFALGDLDRQITDTAQYEIFLDEIVSIYELIEELKLYENTGL